MVMYMINGDSGIYNGLYIIMVIITQYEKISMHTTLRLHNGSKLHFVCTIDQPKAKLYILVVYYKGPLNIPN